MLLIVAAGMLAVFAVLWLTKRKKEYGLLCALAASLLLYLTFMLIYIAKKGGIGQSLSTVLFVTDGLRRRLQYLRLTLRQLGYGLAVGRYLFPYLFLLVALHHSDSRLAEWLRAHWWAAAVCPAVSLVLYYPRVFTFAARTQAAQRAAVYLSLAWVVAYLALGVWLLLREVSSTRIRYVRDSMLARCVMLVSIAALYALYCPQDPAQVYLFYSDGYMAGRGLWYMNPYLSLPTYLLVLVANGVSLLVGVLSMLSLARMEWSEDADEVRLQREYDALSMGGSVFVHGIKNQLLTNRVLCRRLNEQLAADPPDLEQARECARQLAENNAGLLAHVEELYKSFRSNALSMRQCEVDRIVAQAVDGLHKKYPGAQVQVHSPPGLQVLADEAHLCAALVNLLLNGWEATLAARRTEPLAVSCCERRRNIEICIRDHGVGIGKYDLNRIFDPFYSSKNSKSNWGLGLYYVRSIVKKHMGTLRVDTVVGRGTSFYVLLPKLLPARGKKGGGV